MIYLKWFALSLVDLVLLVTVPLAAPVIAAFTSVKPYKSSPYTWGWIWGTYDNPPQGDQGYVKKRCPFPGEVLGFKGYVNRVQWMIRNPVYGYARKAAIEWSPGLMLSVTGNPDISDKYKVPGWYMARLKRGSRLVGFEFYAVLPWCKTRDLRMRLGWKLVTDKFADRGFAPLVNTFNPFDGYGDE